MKRAIVDLSGLLPLMCSSKTAVPLIVIVFTLLNTSCSLVQPWERGNLAKPQMALEPEPSQSVLRAHNYGSREAAAGGNAPQGGGCGCY